MAREISRNLVRAKISILRARVCFAFRASRAALVRVDVRFASGQSFGKLEFSKSSRFENTLDNAREINRMIDAKRGQRKYYTTHAQYPEPLQSTSRRFSKQKPQEARWSSRRFPAAATLLIVIST